MAILCVNIDRIEASINRQGNFGGEIMVNSSPTIKSLAEKQLDLPGIKTAIAADFEFNTVYEPKLGGIKITGEILFTDDNAKKIIEEWKRDKKVANEVGISLMNAIFRRCLTKAIGIAEDLQLPPPIVFPSVVHTDDVKAAKGAPEKEKEHKKK